MDIIKSNRITLLPILNKNKQLILDTYLNNLFIAKNYISSLSINDDSFQNLLFSKDKDDNKLLLSYYINFQHNIFTKWELQKFVNSDLIDKEKNRIESFFIQYKQKLFKYQFDKKSKKYKNLRFSSTLGKLIKLMVKNLFYKDYFLDEINNIISSKPFFIKYKDRIESLVYDIYNRYKYHRKPIIYNTSSLIKCGQKDLGNTKPRIIKDNGNSEYLYWYILDYIDLEDNKKKYLKLPLAYNESYHYDFSQYNKSLDKNKFKKGKDKDGIRDSIINYEKLDKNFEVLFEKEHQISLSKSKNRLTITLPKKVEHNLVESTITKDNCLGIDKRIYFNNCLLK